MLRRVDPDVRDLAEIDRAQRGDIGDGESVADHSWAVAFLATLLCPEELNREKVLIMAILHDLAEVRVGDITPYDGVPVPEKHAREARAMEAMLVGSSTTQTIR